MTGLNASEADRAEAVKRAEEASDHLDDAARELGYEDMDALAHDAPDLDLSRREEEAVKAITNAHSYLNNGAVIGLMDDGGIE